MEHLLNRLAYALARQECRECGASRADHTAGACPRKPRTLELVRGGRR